MQRLAVVIPAFNAGRFLGTALKSVLAQSRRADEVVVVDDASIDDTVAIAADHGVRVVRHGTNRGPAAARNTGIAATEGEYVAFLDADDHWAPEHCAGLVPLLEAHPRAALAYARCWRTGRFAGALPLGLPSATPVEAFWTLLRDNCVTQSATIVRRSALAAAGGYNERMRFADDYDLWLRLARRAPIIGLDQVSCGRRTHAEQISGIPGAIVRDAWEARLRIAAEVRRDGTSAERARLRPALAEAWELSANAARLMDRDADLAVLLAIADELELDPALVRSWRRYRRLVLPVRRFAVALRDRLPRRRATPELPPAWLEPLDAGSE